jgi:hypothetical protein
MPKHAMSLTATFEVAGSHREFIQIGDQRNFIRIESQVNGHAVLFAQTIFSNQRAGSPAGRKNAWL